MVLPQLFNFAYSDIFLPLKTFVFGKHKVSDRPFKIATKYTAVLIAICMCAATNVQLSCKGMPENKRSYAESFCYTQDTYVVAKCLERNMSKVPYPGVCGHDPTKDQIIRLRYYKQLFIIFLILMAMVFTTHFFWKVSVYRRISPFLCLTTGCEIAHTFLKTKGSNAFLGNAYVFYKMITLLLPLVQYFFLCVNLGSRFHSYGYDNLMLFFKSTWPNPRDALFPKMAKCLTSRIGYNGDEEIMSILCQLPTNIYMQWCFLVYWFWIVFVFIVCSISCLYTISTWMSACLFKKPIEMAFGDWVLMKFIEMNLNHSQYIDFENNLRSSTNTEVTNELTI